MQVNCVEFRNQQDFSGRSLQIIERGDARQMALLIALLPKSLGNGSIGRCVHYSDWRIGRKLCQLFTELALDDNVDLVWNGNHNVSQIIAPGPENPD